MDEQMKHAVRRLPGGLTLIEVVLTALLCLTAACLLNLHNISLATVPTALPAIAAFLTCLVLGINVWQLVKCFNECKQAGRASWMSVGSWLISMVLWFTGPWVGIAMVISLAMGIPSWARAGGSAATRRSGRMAVCNTLWVFCVVIILHIWATHSPDLRVIA